MRPMPVQRECILIVLVAGIGDLILASKGIRAIRNGYPEAEIHLLTSTDAYSHLVLDVQNGVGAHAGFDHPAE